MMRCACGNQLVCVMRSVRVHPALINQRVVRDASARVRACACVRVCVCVCDLVCLMSNPDGGHVRVLRVRVRVRGAWSIPVRCPTVADACACAQCVCAVCDAA
jgi:hypothetical protein